MSDRGLLDPDPRPPLWLTPLPPLPFVPRHPLEVAVSRIELDDTRRARVESALRNLTSAIKSNPRIAPLVRQLLVQGSYASRSTTRPIHDGEFDVDAVLVMDVRKLPLSEITPQGVTKLLETTLSERKWYAERLEMKRRCARIHYEGGFHVDVLPAHSDGNYLRTGPAIFIPTATGEWESTHPLGFIDWFAKSNRGTGGRLRQVVLLMKRWRDLTFDESERPSSVLLTTLLGQAHPQGARPLLKALVETLEKLDHALAGHHAVPVVTNPSWPSENLARDWSESAYGLFKTRLHEALLTAQLTQSARRGADRRADWRTLFGDVVGV